MSRRRRQDKELWEKVKSTVKPISSNRANFGNAVIDNFQPDFDLSSNGPVRQILPVAKSPEPATNVSRALKPRVLDPAISRKIAKGRISIEGTIDLHGLNQVEAHQRLWRFLDTAFRSGKRTVLVITGKGVEGEGVLRRSVPRWLEGSDFLTFVSGSQEAHISHGGSGALYVRIRKNTRGMHS